MQHENSTGKWFKGSDVLSADSSVLATAVRTCASILGVKKVLFLDGGCTVTPICSVSAISTRSQLLFDKQ